MNRINPEPGEQPWGELKSRLINEEEIARVTKVVDYLRANSLTPPPVTKYPVEMRFRMHLLLIGVVMGIGERRGVIDIADVTLTIQVLAQLGSSDKINEFIGWKGESQQ